MRGTMSEQRDITSNIELLLETLPLQIKRAALLIYRLGRLPSDRSSIVQVRLGEAFG